MLTTMIVRMTEMKVRMEMMKIRERSAATSRTTSMNLAMVLLI